LIRGVATSSCAWSLDGGNTGDIRDAANAPWNGRCQVTRKEARGNSELRPLTIERSFLKHAEGSAFATLGSTRVICAASISRDVPDFRRESGGGWVTADYSMLPRSTSERKPRPGPSSPQDKRSIEISRFIGRCLRAVIDLDALGPQLIRIDCDVVDADAGTRVVALTGGLVALHDALLWLHQTGALPTWPLREYVVGIGVALLGDTIVLDPSYEEDRDATLDLSLAVAHSGRLVEIHGASEGRPYDTQTLNRMIEAGIQGARALFRAQESAIGKPSPGGPNPSL
jgi:ribonuclease PH